MPAPAIPSVLLQQIPGSLQIVLGLPVLIFFKMSKPDLQERMPTRLRPRPSCSGDLLSLNVELRRNIQVIEFKVHRAYQVRRPRDPEFVA